MYIESTYLRNPVTKEYIALHIKIGLTFQYITVSIRLFTAKQDYFKLTLLPQHFNLV